MQQTTHASKSGSAEPRADAGAYDYAPPVVSGAGQPATQPAPKLSRESWKGAIAIAAVSLAAPMLHDLSGWPRLHCYLLLYCVATVFSYWETPKPRQNFLRWTLKVVGIFLNFFVAFVTVPLSLLGLLPDSLAFALPAFAFMVAFYWVPPLLQARRTTPLWQWLLWSAGFAALWGWLGPSVPM
jgi:hypothetical protein